MIRITYVFLKFLGIVVRTISLSKTMIYLGKIRIHTTAIVLFNSSKI